MILQAPPTCTSVTPSPTPALRSSAPRLQDQVVQTIRALHYSRRTEQAYWHWTRQFILWSVLTVAHLNHEPEDCRPENLAAMCQRHHLAYDAKHHKQTAYATRRRATMTPDLFDAA